MGFLKNILAEYIFRLFFTSILMFYVAKSIPISWENFINTEYQKHYFPVIMMSLHHFTYYSTCTLFFIFDKFHLFSSYKIERKSFQLPDSKLIEKSIKSQLFDHFIFQPFGFYLVYYLIQFFGGFNYSSDSIGSLREIIPKLILGNIYVHTAFYICHRLLHEVPFLFINVHKVHHEYKGSITLASEHTHWVETLINDSHVILPPIILNFHLNLWIVWFVFILWDTCEQHSGYHFPWSYTKYHDLHHTNNMGNYSGNHPIYDILFNTFDTKYLKHLK